MSGKAKMVFNKVRQEVKEAMAALSQKYVSGKMAVYIVNHVLIPKVTYRLLTSTTNFEEILSIERLWLTWIKNKFKLPRSFPNRELYSLTHLKELAPVIYKNRS